MPTICDVNLGDKDTEAPPEVQQISSGILPRILFHRGRIPLLRFDANVSCR